LHLLPLCSVMMVAQRNGPSPGLISIADLAFRRSSWRSRNPAVASFARGPIMANAAGSASCSAATLPAGAAPPPLAVAAAAAPEAEAVGLADGGSCRKRPAAAAGGQPRRKRPSGRHKAGSRGDRSGEREASLRRMKEEILAQAGTGWASSRVRFYRASCRHSKILWSTPSAGDVGRGQRPMTVL